ncbi:MAG: Abi family protein [Alphaproteobacteria bacterium]|nr:Abi family protein [Alphaproteobacteria bacterium]
MPESSRIFDKKASTLDKQIALLSQRGLVIKDEPKARHYLTNIGYYHLSGYMTHFQHCDRTDSHHQFFPGTTFDQILDVYTFDRKLRLLIMDAVERIEIAVKSAMINDLCVLYGPHWYMNKNHFTDGFKYDGFLQSIQKDIDHGKGRDKIKNASIRHYYETYDAPAMPPLWMVFEVLSFGTVSLMFGWLPHADQKRLSGQFNLGVPVLKSWLHATTIIRNLCAHHSRLWNRIFTFKPLIPKGMEADFTPNTLFYAQALMLNVLMHSVSPESRWTEKLKDLLDEYPAIPKEKMGFPENWHNLPVWKVENKNQGSK